MLVAAADYVFGLNLLSTRKISPVLAVVLIVLAYVTGQIVAHFSAFLLEQTIVGRVLTRPSSLLLGGKPRLRLFKWVFPQYHRALPKATQDRVREQAAARGCSAEGEGLFLHAYAIATRNDRVQARLDDFRNQYGFHRNMSLAFLVSAAGIAVAHLHGYPVHLRWSLLAAFGGVTLFYRYLKFFRQYSYELFLRYAELPVADAKGASAGA